MEADSVTRDIPHDEVPLDPVLLTIPSDLPHIEVRGLPWLGGGMLDGFEGDHHIAHGIGVEPSRSIEPEQQRPLIWRRGPVEVSQPGTAG